MTFGEGNCSTADFEDSPGLNAALSPMPVETVPALYQVRVWLSCLTFEEGYAVRTVVEGCPDLNAGIKAIQLYPAAALSPVPVANLPALYQVRRGRLCLLALREGSLQGNWLCRVQERLSAADNDTPSLLSLAFGLHPTRCSLQVTDTSSAPLAKGRERILRPCFLLLALDP